MRPRPWKTLILVGLFLFLILSFSIYSQLEFPAPGGPYAVGRTVVRWVDSSRPEVLTEDPNDFREVIAMVWYPAEAQAHGRAEYFPQLAVVSQALVQSGEVQGWEVFGLRFLRAQIGFDARPLPSRDPFPVVIFSPGNGTNIEFYASLISEIASHGYIVVGINHPYDVPAVKLSRGTIAQYDRDQWLLESSAHQAYIADRIKVRTMDLLFALAQLESVNSNASSPLVGLLDLDAVAVAGHSLGGITASEACKADGRLKACVNFDGIQAGGPFSMDGNAIPPAQPFLFLTKEEELLPHLIERFSSMPEGYWVVVHGASHQSFTDSPLMQPSVLPGPKEADRLMDLIQKYSLAFFDHTLKGQPTPLLSKTVDREDVSVRVFPSN